MKRKSGLADSPFFQKPPQADNQVKPESDQEPGEANERDTVVPRHHDTMKPRNHDTVIPRNHDTAEVPNVIETVRKAVKELGKEAATHRFTTGEKKALADLIYTYKQQGVKTSENEVARIAINYMIEDYRANGERSVLAQVLKKLNE